VNQAIRHVQTLGAGRIVLNRTCSADGVSVHEDVALHVVSRRSSSRAHQHCVEGSSSFRGGGLTEVRSVTITNIGSVGGTYATPIINHPEVAILGMYKFSDKLILGKDNQIQVVKVMNFTITADHRLIDGAVAANFLKLFISKISKPGMLMMDMH
jgi:hypothetical protein